MDLLYPDGVVLHGDCRLRLADLPAESVQCCVCSPPYFGLRRYSGLPDSVWGGRFDCEHDWRPTEHHPKYGGTNASTLGKASGGHDMSDEARKRSTERSFYEAGKHYVCVKCLAWKGQLGNEPTVDLYLAHLVEVFRAVRRVLRRDSVCFVNLGDGYGDKNLNLVPERFALAMQNDGWIIRSRIVWAKKSAMPESVTDRPTSAHETIWMLTKEPRYFYDSEAVKTTGEIRNYGPDDIKRARNVGGRSDGYTRTDGGPGLGNFGLANLRNTWLDVDDRADLSDLWELGPEPFSGAHFATYPTKLVKRCILASTSERGCCSKCGAPYRRDKQSEKCDNSKHEGIRLPQVSGASSRDSIREGQTEEERPALLVSGVRRSGAEVSLAGETGRGTIEGGRISTPERREGSRAQENISVAGDWERVDAQGFAQVPTNGQGSRVDPSEWKAPAPNGSGQTSPAHSDDTAPSSLDERPWSVHGRRLAKDSGDSGEPLQVLRQTIHGPDEADDRSRDATVEGRRSLPGEHRSGLPQLQFNQVHQGSHALISGWSPTCKCNAGCVPSIVLDPFLGSGTTAAAARSLGRRFVGVEGSAEYFELSRKRIESTTLALAEEEAAIDAPAQLSFAT